MQITQSRLVSETDAAKYLGVSVGWLRFHRYNIGRFETAVAPPHVKLGRLVRYDLDDLARWVEEHKIVA